MRNAKKSIALFGMGLLLAGSILSCKSKEGMNDGTAGDTTTVSDTTSMAPEPTPGVTDTMTTDTVAMPAK
ncbi:MAG: hypothetical protein EOO10_18180 [Chitinophagaceae bacterium]|nr:MAG: hypothetical protein EOO10_18180 [Chitinophagaceae bacterium]